ncbi:MAG TPA: AmmeMemoRadiSam system radical SAM enzyme [Thermoanaerobacterales bacterium]|nr:AmmeMemoRadiSam system radical SAM enzyme [Thermoanaerobacterales bacterium]
MEKAKYYEVLADGKIRCLLCPQNCIIAENRKGFCRARENLKGELYSTNYGRISSYGLDPMEKKPLYHFYPGSTIFSIGTIGCNFRCPFCQNWQISQIEDRETIQFTPQKIVSLAKSFEGNIGIAYTYSEPLIWYEYVYETARLVKESGLVNVLVTNGFIEEEPLKELLPYIDAMNIDVKGFSQEFYKEYTKGDIGPVKRTVELAHKNCHVEVTTLLISGLNDSEKEIESLCSWLASLRKDIPLHLSRYFPNYKMDLPATSLDTMERAYDTASKYLEYVYLGNVRSKRNNTYCPQCGALLIDRQYFANIVGITGNGICASCGKDINIVM